MMLYILPRYHFDKCIIKIDKDRECVIYDYDLLVESYTKLGMSYTDAVDWVNHGIIGAEINQHFPKVI
jgi:hypothetical protein